MARGLQTKMLLVYVGSGEDLICQECEHINKVHVSKSDTTLMRSVFYVVSVFVVQLHQV